jgi:hypothetical protein
VGLYGNNVLLFVPLFRSDAIVNRHGLDAASL